MINEKIEGFLEQVNMNYLFCLLSKLEAQRLNQFPSYVKQKFDKKITVLSMEHVADNEVPDYMSELEEAQILEAQARAALEEDDEFAEITVDDSVKFARNIQNDVSAYASYEEEVVPDPFGSTEDDDDEFDSMDDDDLDDDDE